MEIERQGENESDKEAAARMVLEAISDLDEAHRFLQRKYGLDSRVARDILKLIEEVREQAKNISSLPN